MLEGGAVIAGIIVARRVWPQPLLLRAALLAQVADFVTFALHREAEVNPLASVVVAASDALNPILGGLAPFIAGGIAIALKIGLIAYLAWAAPRLGRYEKPVLWLALVAGLAGAASNIAAFPVANPG